MKYIAAVVLLSFGALGFFLYYQSHQSGPDAAADMSSSISDPHLQGGAVAGKVIETMDAGGYTYVQVDTGPEKIWAAGPLTEVSVGDKVSFVKGMEMQGFTSETLDRTFDLIYFVTSINTGEVPMQAMRNPHGENPHAESPHAGLVDNTPDLDYSGIALPEGGTRIASVYENKNMLAGKEVVVSGRVVKYTPGVMDRNWIHVRDGSGGDGTNDLTVTTDTSVNVGQKVIVKGTLATNKDFGFGYAYEVILENASVITEQ